MELLGHQPNYIHGTAHWGELINGGHPNLGAVTYSDFPKTFSDEYHVFSLVWSTDTMTWLITTNHAFNSPRATRGHEWSRDALQRSGFLSSTLRLEKLAGYPDETTLFPKFMAVDYVRVYQGGNRMPNPNRGSIFGTWTCNLNLTNTTPFLGTARTRTSVLDALEATLTKARKNLLEAAVGQIGMSVNHRHSLKPTMTLLAEPVNDRANGVPR